jgi:drug/metabolite transporter (DMT)-like permease
VIENNNFLFLYGAAGMFYVADVLQKKTSFKKNTWGYLKIRSSFSFPIAFLISALITGFSDTPNFWEMSQLMGASAVCSLGLYFYIKAVNHTHFSNVGSLSIVGNVFQWMIGWLFFSESISWMDLPAMLLMFSGCMIQMFNSKLSKGAFYVLACSFFWVLGFSLLSVGLKKSNVYWSIPIMEGSIWVLSILASRFEKSDTLTQKKSNPYFFLWLSMIAVFIYGGSVLNHFAYKLIPLSTISMLQLSLIPIGFIFSLKLFNEKPSKTEWISFFLGLFGFAYLHFIRHQLI